MPNSSEHASSFAEARFAALLDAAVDAILVIDSNGQIETFNRAAERLFGYQSVEICGQNVSTLMPDKYSHAHDSYLQRYLTTGERRIIGIGREVSAMRRDGSVFPVELSVGEVATGEKRRFVGIIRDISERRASEQELRQQQERLEHVTRLGTLGEMAAGIAHEINQPLTAIATYAHAARRLLSSDRMDAVRLDDVLGKMATQAERAGQIIERIRDLARRQSPSQELCDLNAIMDETLKLAEVDARYHDAPIVVEMTPGLPHAWLNSVQIQQVVLNLLRNAIEAGGAGTKLKLRTYARSKEELVVEVEDNGPGVPESLRTEIFNPFFTTRTDGTGMGLSISRSIVASHGGRIEVDAAPTGGAVFRVTLPTALGEIDE
ncbi:MAG: PAS domain S-box protein [Gammaproteobacteria bacterium]|nr:PAS domain S-box protein [Gammaproteobacteria bacterium]